MRFWWQMLAWFFYSEVMQSPTWQTPRAPRLEDKFHDNDRLEGRSDICICIYIYIYIHIHTHVHVKKSLGETLFERHRKFRIFENLFNETSMDSVFFCIWLLYICLSVLFQRLSIQWQSSWEGDNLTHLGKSILRSGLPLCTSIRAFTRFKLHPCP